MFPFLDFFLPVLNLSIILLIISFGYIIIKNKISFSDYTSFLCLLIVSGTAVFFTGFKTMLLPVFILTLVLPYFFRQSKNQIYNDGYKSILLFLGIYILSSILVYLFLLKFSILNPENFIIVHKDHHFYINEALQIAETGIENVSANSYNLFASPYHYFDLWILKLLYYVTQNLNVLYLTLFIPIFYALTYLNLVDIVKTIKNKKLVFLDYFFIFFVPIIVPLPFLPYSVFEDISAVNISPFSYSKGMVVIWLFSIVIKKYLEKESPFTVIIISIIASCSFITILPSLLLFAGCLYIFKVLINKKIFFSTKNYLFLLSILGIIAYFYFLYVFDIPKKAPINQEIKSINFDVKIKYLALMLLFILMYSACFVPLIFKPFKQVITYFKNYLLLLTIPIGGILVAILLSDRIPNSFQFYTLSYLGFFPLFIVIILYQFNWNKLITSYFIGLILIMVYYQGDRFTIEKIDQEDYELSKEFLSRNKPSKNIGFIMPKGWKPSAITNLPEFFAPNDILINSLLPHNIHWLEIYKDGVDKNDLFYNFSVNLLKDTDYDRFCKENNHKSEFDNQFEYIKNHNIKTLIVGNDSKLNPKIKKLAIDSVEIEYNPIYLYENKKFLIYQLK